MTADRDLLAAALGDHVDWNAERLADALLPVVDRIANQRAAAELRAAADWGESRTRIAQWGPYLRARAAELGPSS